MFKMRWLFALTGLTNFSMESIRLEANGYQAVRVSPMLSMQGIIYDVTFTNHRRGVLLIDNTDNLQRNRAFLDKKVDYNIIDNK